MCRAGEAAPPPAQPGQAEDLTESFSSLLLVSPALSGPVFLEDALFAPTASKEFVVPPPPEEPEGPPSPPSLSGKWGNSFYVPAFRTEAVLPVADAPTPGRVVVTPTRKRARGAGAGDRCVNVLVCLSDALIVCGLLVCLCSSCP